ncbi:MAG: NTP transferase domain-containing protein [Saprospiraceae bacterium]|nr:NTP transferase domain-containing protein [Saprospiraceae bacterium]
MKAIIPVAGAGTRLRPHTYTRPKPLIPVAGKPIISFIIDQLVEIGVQEFILVIGYLGDKIKQYIETRHKDLDIKFVYQDDRLGLGHAVWVARETFQHSEEILIALGDTIFETNLNVFLEQENSCIAVQKVSDPRNFGVVEFDQDNYIKRVIEKPRIPKSNMAIVGVYKIKEVDLLIESLDYIIKNDIRTLGEYQLTDALMRMIEQGTRLTAHRVNNWFDCGRKEILLDTNAMLLKRLGYNTKPKPTYPNTIIIEPVHIGEGCEIKNSIIGPNVTIGNNSKIGSSIIRNSIIGNYSTIEDVLLQKSVIGSDAAIRGASQSLNIGDNTEIDFN